MNNIYTWFYKRKPCQITNMGNKTKTLVNKVHKILMKNTVVKL